MSEFTKLLNSVKNESKDENKEHTIVVTDAEIVLDIPTAVPLLAPVNDLIPDIESNESLYKGTYKISIKNRSYNDYIIHDSSSLKEQKHIQLDPAEHKLFNGEGFQYHLTEPHYRIEYSSIRNISYISGILVCQNQTYGRIKNKFYYKCIPDDRRLPHFLVPYEIKGNSFSKNFKNKYVNFKFKSWDSKHPIGELIQLIGDVGKLENFYEYQLYCKSLNTSIQSFTKDTLKILKMKTFDEYTNIIMKKYDIESRISSKYNIFTIDSQATTDFDDAISINFDSHTSCYNISIYISNVALWIDALDLWDSFSERISTIYMPDRKRPMLPTILSECLCSLQEKQNRFALALDLIVDKNGNIISRCFNNVLIRVNKNYIYEKNDLLHMNDYKLLYDVVGKMNKIHSYSIILKSSNDVVAYLMILMNYCSALSFQKYGNGIYRTNTFKDCNNNNTALKNSVNFELLDMEIQQFMKIWNSNAGQYVSYNQFEKDNKIYRGHQMLDLEAYVHITSPIRRIVDLLNIIILQQNELSCTFNHNCRIFLEKWHNDIEYINISMRAIRQVQTQCTLLELCVNNPNIQNIIYSGYVFDKFERNDGMVQYTVYIDSLKLVSRVTSRIYKDNYTKCKFKIYVFEDEDQYKKKVRVDLLTS
jgi:exoribonuclease R